MTLYAEVIGDPISHSKSPVIHGFWLKKLDDNNGNFVQAQMVKAFLDSFEYRARF